MSKADKAEQRALEAYPVLMRYNDFQMVEEDINKPLREIYQEGYHQAEKDTIEKAAKWLKNNLEGVVGGSIYIEDFLKAMKDE